MCAELISLGGPLAVIRTDAPQGFVALTNDKLLAKHRVFIESGTARIKIMLQKDLYKNFKMNLLLINYTLYLIVTAGLNAWVQSRSLLSHEMIMQRDQFTSEQLPINDLDLIIKQS